MRTLLVRYSTPSRAVSGELIDFDEAIRVEALDAMDQLLDFVVICHNDSSASCEALGGETGPFTTGDGVTTAFSFDRPQADIRSLRIVCERNASGGFGLAFDNFETGVVPEPGAGLLIGSPDGVRPRPASAIRERQPRR